jgi:hypothetical protein
MTETQDPGSSSFVFQRVIQSMDMFYDTPLS